MREPMSLHEIVLPDTEPETEWILGRAVQKVSPTWSHGRLQAAFTIALGPWAEGRGQLATEWRFRPAPPNEIRRPLVPDISYVSNERFSDLEEGLDSDAPPFSPDVAIEILSPGDGKRRLDHKIRVYLASGAELVIVVDPRDRSVRLHDVRGVRVLRGDDVIVHPAMPDFALSLPKLFSALDRPPKVLR